MFMISENSSNIIDVDTKWQIDFKIIHYVNIFLSCINIWTKRWYVYVDGVRHFARQEF